jgi:fructose-1,6-bisphosphatase/inositol monophosphatase family enzyme
MAVDLARVEALIREVAASEIVPRFRRLAAGEIREKQPGQIVTLADEEAERRFTERLPDLLPESVVVGEEGVAADATRLEALAGAAPVWVVDPLDGTQNFSEGKPLFAVMVALVRERRTLAGWIFDPMSDRMAVAEQGAGARLNGVPLRLAPPPPIDQMIGRVGGKTAANLRGKIQAVVNLRCAGHEYLRLVTQQIHFSLYRRLFPWDHAPGELILREAGGHAGTLEGRPFTPGEINASLLLTPDQSSWDAIRALILEAAPG